MSWKGTPALYSPLQKNQDLRAVLLEETPWVRQAESESEARRNVGILFDDITIQKRVAQEQQRAHEGEIRLREAANEANRAKDEFMALLGHELRNPLTPILATLDLMRLQGKKVFVHERKLLERQNALASRVMSEADEAE